MIQRKLWRKINHACT